MENSLVYQTFSTITNCQLLFFLNIFCTNFTLIVTVDFFCKYNFWNICKSLNFLMVNVIGSNLKLGYFLRKKRKYFVYYSFNLLIVYKKVKKIWNMNWSYFKEKFQVKSKISPIHGSTYEIFYKEKWFISYLTRTFTLVRAAVTKCKYFFFFLFSIFLK